MSFIDKSKDNQQHKHWITDFSSKAEAKSFAIMRTLPEVIPLNQMDVIIHGIGLHDLGIHDNKYQHAIEILKNTFSA